MESILEELGISETDFSKLVTHNNSLKGIISGYVSEWHFEKTLDSYPLIQSHYKPDDHDKTKKGDRIVHYRDQDISIEVRAIVTKSIKKYSNLFGNTVWKGEFKTCCARTRKITFSDGSEQFTCNNPRNLVDIYCVCAYPCTKKWDFMYCLNTDIPSCSSCKKFTQLQKEEVLQPIMQVSWPPTGVFTTDLNVVLEKAYLQKTKS